MTPIDAWNTIVILTLDSLRFDTTQRALTPNFERLLRDYASHPNWVRTYTHGTYTLPAHISMLLAGKFPQDLHGPAPHHRGRLFEWFSEPGIRQRKDSFLDAYRQKGYAIHGFGSVGWFSNQPTSQFLWSQLFDTFTYKPEFAPEIINGLEHQIAALAPHYTQSVLFMNIGSTHFPFNSSKTDIRECTIADQIMALEYVDTHLWSIINRCARPTQVYITGDHGECFGEDGQWGHGFYHPCVMEVPSLYAELPVTK